MSQEASSALTDLECARRIAQGDVRAFEVLFRRYYGALYAFARQRVRAHEVAEELAQEVFLDVWNRRSAWPPERSVRAFLFSAIRYKTVDYWRRWEVESRWKEGEVREAAGRVEEPADRLREREIDEAVRQAISEMPERRRLAYVLTKEHGLTYAEAADVLGISPKTVEVQIGRALKFLRERLAYLLAVLV